MGDRYFDTRHPNLELMLRRLPGIGHNGGPPLDMSWTAWVWRRAVRKAWATPPREVALRRMRHAARLGLTYRDYAAALLDTGANLSTALLPLHHLAELRPRDGMLEYHPAVLSAVRRFEGRLLLVVDEAASGRIPAPTHRRLLAQLHGDAGGSIEAVLVLPFKPLESDAARALRLRRLLKKHSAPRKECFWLGATPAESQLAEQSGLGWFKPVSQWFVEIQEFLEKDTA